MKTSYQRITLLVLATALLALFGASCSTVRGVGQDVEKAGEHIEDASR
jgi:predicted small secreted protein